MEDGRAENTVRGWASSSQKPSHFDPPSSILHPPSSKASSLPHHHSLRIRREGWIWLFLTAFLLGTGLYKGINLLTFLGTSMTSAWLLHLFWTRRGLRSLELHQGTMGEVFALTPFVMTVEVRNRGRRPLHGLRVETQVAGQRWSYFIARLDGGTKASFQTEVMVPRPGIYAGQGSNILSGFPFGLMQGRIRKLPDEEFVVFPRLGRLHRGMLRRMLTGVSPSVGRARANPRLHPAAQSDFHGLRAYRSGDSPHWIHWRTSARMGELMVREFEETPNDNLTILVDAWLPSGSGSGSRQTSDKDGTLASSATLSASSSARQRLDDVISLAATICSDWCEECGNRLVLGVADKNPLVLTGESGPDLRRRLLRALAGVTGHSDADVIQLVASMRPILPPGPVLVLTTSPGNLLRTLEQEFHRPVTCLHVSSLAQFDFFEW